MQILFNSDGRILEFSQELLPLVNQAKRNNQNIYELVPGFKEYISGANGRHSMSLIIKTEEMRVRGRVLHYPANNIELGTCVF